MYYDFGIERVCNAIYVMPGKGAPIHQNRPFYGLAFHLHPKQKKEYVFSDGKKIEIGENIVPNILDLYNVLVAGRTLLSPSDSGFMRS